MKSFFEKSNTINTNKVKVNEYPTLTLAYIGDAIFEVCARDYVLNNSNSNRLHNKAKKLVSATAQAKMYSILEDFLTEEEFNVLKRGRNAKTYSSSKNSDLNDYKKATGVESLFGYLYLKEEYNRIIEIFNYCLKILN